MTTGFAYLTCQRAVITGRSGRAYRGGSDMATDITRHSRQVSADHRRPARVRAGARRMGGGDKPLREIGGSSISRTGDRTEWSRSCLKWGALILKRQWRSHSASAFTGLPVVGRRHPRLRRPRSPASPCRRSITWRRHQPPKSLMCASAAADTPFLPRDLRFRRLHGQRCEGSPAFRSACAGE